MWFEVSHESSDIYQRLYSRNVSFSTALCQCVKGALVIKGYYYSRAVLRQYQAVSIFSSSWRATFVLDEDKPKPTESKPFLFRLTI